MNHPRERGVDASHHYEMDAELGALVLRLSGVLRAAELARTLDELMEDPHVDATGPLLVELTGVTEFQVSSDDMGMLARTPFAQARAEADAPTVIVGDSDLAFGLARMYQVRSGREEGRIRVCRSELEAREWLKSMGSD